MFLIGLRCHFYIVLRSLGKRDSFNENQTVEFVSFYLDKI